MDFQGDTVQSIIAVFVQSLSHIQLFVTSQHARQASVSFTISQTAQTPVHWVDDAIQPSHSLSSPSPPAFNLSQHQGLFQWVGSLHQVTKVLELQHQHFQWIFRVDFLWDWLVWSPGSPRDSQEPSPAPQFESINSSTLSLFCNTKVTFGKTMKSNSQGCSLSCCL